MGAPPAGPSSPRRVGGSARGGNAKGRCPRRPPAPPTEPAMGSELEPKAQLGGHRWTRGGGGWCQGGTCPTPPNPAPAAHPKPLPRENEAPQFSGGGKWVTQGTNWSMGVSCGGAETPSDPRQIGEGGQTGPWGGERRGIRHLGGGLRARQGSPKGINAAPRGSQTPPRGVNWGSGMGSQGETGA